MIFINKLVDKFIDKASLPTEKVTLAAVSASYPKIIEALNLLGIRTILTEPYKNNINNPESTHADMQILHLGYDRIVLLCKNNKFNDKLNCEFINKKADIIYTSSPIKDFKYPQCVKLNIALVGNNAIGCFKYCDEAVLKALDGYNLINVNQGYAKCSTAIVNDNAIITSDNSISTASKKSGIDCLKISEGYIYLCEKYSGFIGGACFMIDKNTLAFTGDISCHPDYISIKTFCANYGINLLSLTNDILCDVGGIVPLMQISDCENLKI